MTSTITHAELLAALEREQQVLEALLPRFSDAQWRSLAREDGWSVHDLVMHIADSTYGLGLLLLGEAQVNMPLDQQTGWYNPDAYNEQRRQKHAELTREKATSRIAGAFAQARRAIEGSPDLAAPSPLSDLYTRGQWLERMIGHVGGHRQELADLLEQHGAG